MSRKTFVGYKVVNCQTGKDYSKGQPVTRNDALAKVRALRDYHGIKAKAVRVGDVGL